MFGTHHYRRFPTDPCNHVISKEKSLSMTDRVYSHLSAKTFTTLLVQMTHSPLVLSHHMSFSHKGVMPTRSQSQRNSRLRCRADLWLLHPQLAAEVLHSLVRLAQVGLQLLQSCHLLVMYIKLQQAQRSQSADTLHSCVLRHNVHVCCSFTHAIHARHICAPLPYHFSFSHATAMRSSSQVS